jgi:hypothetical protein
MIIRKISLAVSVLFSMSMMAQEFVHYDVAIQPEVKIRIWILLKTHL